MGLAGPKKRVKLSHDPNNINWSRSSTNYGHRMLQSQGWSPGDPLGAASSAGRDTGANVRRIRVQMKDDNSGLGARLGRPDEDRPSTGLSGFQDLLGRLNNKTGAKISEEQQVRQKLQTSRYLDRQSTVHFVSGGLLVQDKQQLNPEKVGVPRAEGPVDPGQFNMDRKRRKRKDKDPSRAVSSLPSLPSGIMESSEPANHYALTAMTEKENGKIEKKADKLARRLKRETRKQKKAASFERQSSCVGKESAKRVTEPTASSKMNKPEDESLGLQRDSSVPHSVEKLEGRHAVRQRFIRHKKMAMMDRKALNEILMIKS